MTTEDEYVFFWRVNEQYGFLSQWFYLPFVADGITFVTAEQYMMYRKAVLFSDSETALKIANTPLLHPSEHKRMGRTVRNFNENVWNNQSMIIVAGVNYFKFMQSDTLRNLLTSTGKKTLVEASPNDRIWGIGFDSMNAIVNVNSWGSNRLGRALMMVRDEITNLP